MKQLVIYEDRPDYVFGSDECDTVLIWPDVAVLEDGEKVNCLHTAERMEDGEIVECRIYNWPMPKDRAEYDEMIEDIAGTCEIEHC